MLSQIQEWIAAFQLWFSAWLKSWLFTDFFTQDDLVAVSAQLELVLFASFILLLDFFFEGRWKIYWARGIALSGIGFSAAVLLIRIPTASSVGRFTGTNGMPLVVMDNFFFYFSLVFLFTAAIVILMSFRYLEIEEESEGEYYSLILFATAGMMFMAGGVDLITLFIGLELMAISFYILTGFLRSDRRSNEAAIKYFLLGVFSSGILAYGFSLMYGMAGSTSIDRVAQALGSRGPADPMAFLAVVTVAAGILFKVAAVPFHQWAPDIYEGAPTPITAFLSAGSKAAGVAFLLRVLAVPLASEDGKWADWTTMIAAVAVASMVIGNLAALNQDNIKRLLAYSSIGHVGYILLGVVAGNETGWMGVSFYVFAYAVMTLGAFAVVTAMRSTGIAGDRIDDFRGLMHRSPVPAILMLIFLLSLIGMPGTGGFMAKYFIFFALIETGHYTLAIIAALYIVVALYYYLRIVVAMFMSEPQVSGRISPAPGLAIALGVTAALTLWLGFYPEPFIQYAQFSIQHLR